MNNNTVITHQVHDEGKGDNKTRMDTILYNVNVYYYFVIFYSLFSLQLYPIYNET